MVLIWNPVYLLNLVLCFILLVLGYWGYRKTGEMIPFYFALAYGIFAITHFLALLKFDFTIEEVLIVLRTIAYLILAFALGTIIFKKQS